MLSSVAKSSGLAPFLSAVSQAVPSGLRPAVVTHLAKATDPKITPPEFHTNYNVYNFTALSSRGPAATASIGGSAQRRYAHSDVKVPDFTQYRKESVKSADVKSSVSADSRKAFSYVIVAGGTALAAYSAKNLVRGALSVLGASADVLAAGQLEVKLADIPEGKNAVFKWRDKPLFIRHRTAEEIEKEQAVDPSSLRDQEHDNDRVKKPEWLVVLGICTHLGCVPISGVGDYGGYYCPCHGSHYDASGRIRKGPAPLNLEVPEYDFPDEETLLVG